MVVVVVVVVVDVVVDVVVVVVVVARFEHGKLHVEGRTMGFRVL